MILGVMSPSVCHHLTKRLNVRRCSIHSLSIIACSCMLSLYARSRLEKVKRGICQDVWCLEFVGQRSVFTSFISFHHHNSSRLIISYRIKQTLLFSTRLSSWHVSNINFSANKKLFLSEEIYAKEYFVIVKHGMRTCKYILTTLSALGVDIMPDWFEDALPPAPA